MADENKFFFALIPDDTGTQLCVRRDAVQACEVAPDDKAVTFFFENRQIQINDPKVIAAFLVTVGLRSPKSSLIEVPDLVGAGAIKRDFPH